MYITVVEIDMPDGMTRADVDTAIQGTATRYTHVEGLVRKHYVAREPNICGGVYIWESREHAEAAHGDPSWLKLIKDGYKTVPRVSYYDVRLIVDNVSGRILNKSEDL